MPTYILTYDNRPITRVAGENHFLSKTPTDWETMSWHGLTNLNGMGIWSDGTNIYYSWDEDQYVLNRSTKTWEPKVWYGLSSFRGGAVWYNTYSGKWVCSARSVQKELTGSTWYDITWTGDMSSSEFATLTGSKIWLNGNSANRRVYCTVDGYRYRLEGSRYWKFRGTSVSYNPLQIWYPHDFNTDGKTYYSYSNGTQMVIEDGTGSNISWGSIIPSYGQFVWTSSIHTYYSYNAHSYVLNDDKTSWSNKSWTGLNGVTLEGGYMWSDGESTYYSNGSTQLRLVVP